MIGNIETVEVRSSPLVWRPEADSDPLLAEAELAALLGTSRRGAVAAAEAGARAILEAADLASPPRRSAPGAPTR